MRDDDERRTREDNATQPLDAGRLSFAIKVRIFHKVGRAFFLDKIGPG